MVLARLEADDCFGEQALLGCERRRRNASVRSIGASRVLEVSFSALERALPVGSPLRELLQEFGHEQLWERLSARSSIFRTLDLAMPQGEERALRSGEILFQQGAEPDQVYFVIHGRLEVRQTTVDGDSEDPLGKLIAWVGAGQCVGEVGILDRRPRTASARADRPTRVYAIPGETFQAEVASNPELADHLRTLAGVYRLPRRGVVTQHSGHVLGRPKWTTIYHLPDGRRSVASLIAGQAAHVFDTHATVTESFTYEAEVDGVPIVRRIGLDDRRHVVETYASGDWEEFTDLHLQMLDGVPLARWQTSAFRRSGTIRLESPARFCIVTEVVCSCVNVTRGQIDEQIQLGCTTLTELTNRLRCGSVCGGCRPRLQSLLGNEAWSAAPLLQSTERAREIRSFKLTPQSGVRLPYLPGQHLVIQVQVDGEWVDRSYTLCGSGAASDHYEITVKHVSRGQLTDWLFRNHERLGGLLRISASQGDFTWTRDDDPAVALVAGIGMTPALAMARAAAAGLVPHALHVHNSAHQACDFAHREELERLATDSDRVTLTLRETATEGRLSVNDIEQLVAAHPDRAYYLCGPDDYVLTLRRWLEAAGVAPSRIA